MRADIMKKIIVSFFALLLILPAIYACEMWKCEVTRALPATVEMATNEKGEPVFLDKAEYTCNLGSYCDETCTMEELKNLCKITDKKTTSTYTKEPQPDGIWVIYKGVVTTTFRCDSSDSNIPFTFEYKGKDAEFRRKDCSAFRNARDTARAEAARICGEVGSAGTGGAQGGPEACNPKKLVLAEAEAALENAQGELDSLKAGLSNLQNKLREERITLADLEREYEPLKKDYDSAKQRYDESLEELEEAKFEQNLAWWKAISSMSGFKSVTIIVSLVGFYFSKGNPEEFVRLGPEALELPPPFAPFVSVAEQLLTRELEKTLQKVNAALKKAQRAYDTLKASEVFLQKFIDRGAYDRMMNLKVDVPILEKQIEDIEHEIYYKEETDIPSLQHDVDDADRAYQECLEDAARADLEAQQAAQKEREAAQKKACDDARAVQAAAQNNYQNCLDAK